MLYLHQVLAQSTATPDEADGRVYGWLPGVVTDVDTKLMQVKARIGKMDDGDSTHWLVPVGMGAVESLPEVGEPVGVVFMDGDPHSGAYFYFPQSTTKNRPVEALALGTTLAGIVNNLADQVQQLKTTVNTLITLFNAHGHTYVYGTTGPPPSPATADSDPTPAKALAADGSVVSSVTSSKKALSKRGKVK
jgi:hypothetical protein